MVQSTRFNDRSWLDFAGHPHTKALQVTGRFQRRDFGPMQLQLTLDDPKTFTRPIAITLDVNYVPDTEMLKYVCAGNERATQHLVGKASDEMKGEVHVSVKVLSRDAGNYEATEPKMKAAISASGDQLMFSLAGKGAVPLTALSETGFYFPGGFPVDFIKDDNGALTLELHTPCGDFQFIRK